MTSGCDLGIMHREVGPDESIAVAVIDTVSRFEDREASALPPLTESVNPDALDNLFGYDTGQAPASSGHISFEYSNSTVYIGGDGTISVEAMDETPMAVMN